MDANEEKGPLEVDVNEKEEGPLGVDVNEKEEGPLGVDVNEGEKGPLGADVNEKGVDVTVDCFSCFCLFIGGSGIQTGRGRFLGDANLSPLTMKVYLMCHHFKNV